MNCSSSGTTTPGSRKLALKVSTALVAARTSSKRAKYHGPPGARHFDYEPTWVLRGLSTLRIEFTPAEGAS